MTARDQESLLTVRRVTAGYGDLMVLRDLDFAVPSGATTALLGPNGAGKTTLMRAIAGVLPLAGGEIHFDGRTLDKEPTHVRLQEMAWVPEGRLLFSDFSVRDNLHLSARAAGHGREFAETLEECLDLFPALRSKLQVAAGSLSGGQQQMVSIARAIVRRPRLLLLDEPSMGLAPLVLADIQEALRRLQATGLSVLIAEQNIPWLEDLVDSVAILVNGTVVEQGAKTLLLDRDAVRNIYLGA